MVLIGAVAMTAIAVPAVPPRLRARRADRASACARACAGEPRRATPSSAARWRVSPLASARWRRSSPSPARTASSTRRRARRHRRRRRPQGGAAPRHAQRARRLDLVGHDAAAGGGCLVLAAVFSLTGFLPITPGQVVLLSTYFALLTQGLTQLLMLIPVGARGIESVRSMAEVLQEPDLEHNEGKRRVDRVEGASRSRRRPTGIRTPSPTPCTRSTSTSPRARPSPSSARPARASRRSSISCSGSSGPTSGRILLDGADMQQLDLRTVRRSVSVVPQESVLFEGTIRDNVAYGLPAASDRVVREALRAANALEFVDAQSRGWDTVVGERGARLSGGSDSDSRSRGRSCATRGSCCSTRRRAHSTPNPRSSSKRRSAAS